MRLAPVVKEQYLGFVDREHPDLLPRYERAYPGREAPQAYQQALDARVERIRERYGFAERSMRKAGLSSAAEPLPADPLPRRVGPQLLLPMIS